MTQQPDNTPQRDSTPAHSRDGIDLSKIPTQSSGGSEQSWVLDDVDQQSLQTLLQHAASVPLIIHLAAPSNPISGQIDAVLQPAIDARAGRMVMGRINTEQHPQLLQMFGVPAGPMVIALMGQQALPLFNEPVGADQLEQLLDEINASAVQAGMAGTVPPLVEATDADGEADIALRVVGLGDADPAHEVADRGRRHAAPAQRLAQPQEQAQGSRRDDGRQNRRHQSTTWTAHLVTADQSADKAIDQREKEQRQGDSDHPERTLDDTASRAWLSLIAGGRMLERAGGAFHESS